MSSNPVDAAAATSAPVVACSFAPSSPVGADPIPLGMPCGWHGFSVAGWLGHGHGHGQAFVVEASGSLVASWSHSSLWENGLVVNKADFFSCRLVGGISNNELIDKADLFFLCTRWCFRQVDRLFHK